MSALASRSVYCSCLPTPSRSLIRWHDQACDEDRYRPIGAGSGAFRTNWWTWLWHHQAAIGLDAAQAPRLDRMWVVGDALVGPSTVVRATAQGREAAGAVLHTGGARIESGMRTRGVETWQCGPDGGRLASRPCRA